MSEPYVISALCTPFVGMAVDRMGGRATLALVAPLILGAVHLGMGLTLLPAQFLLIGLGLVSSFSSNGSREVGGSREGEACLKRSGDQNRQLVDVAFESVSFP